MPIPMILLGAGLSSTIDIGQLSILTNPLLHALREDSYDNTVDHIYSTAE